MASVVSPIEANHVDSEKLGLSDEKNGYSSVLTEVLFSDRIPEFSAFKLEEINTFPASCFCTAQMLFSIWRAIKVSSVGVPVAYRVITYIKVVVPWLGWLYLHYCKTYVHKPTPTPHGRRIILLGDTLLLLQSLTSSLLFLAWVLTIDDCRSDVCRQDMTERVIPLGQLVLQVGGGVAVPIFYSCHDVVACLGSVVITYAVLLLGASLLNLIPIEMFYISVFAVVIFACLFVYEMQIYNLFCSYSKFKNALHSKLVSENKEYLMKVQTEEMRILIGNVAHDLRTPLQALQCELDVLHDDIREESASSRGDSLHSVTQLKRICNFMHMTINRGIDFTKAASGIKLKPCIESVNLLETINWAIGCLIGSHSKVDITLLPIPKIIHHQIFTDKQWLMENMLCLLSNAQKFTIEGEITIRCSLLNSTVEKSCSVREAPSKDVDYDAVEDIEMGKQGSLTFSLEKSSQMLKIEVEDTGIGISAENRERLFKPFMQAQRRTGGTGLGLYSLSKRLESLDGKCGVRSRSDGRSGSCFWISFPFKRDDSVLESSSRSCLSSSSTSKVSLQDHSPRDSAPEISSLLDGIIKNETDLLEDAKDERRHPKIKILLVDDSVLIRKTTARALRKEGFDVELAQNGAECLNILELSRNEEGSCFGFHLILMDLQMPVMDGYEATTRIRELEKSMLDGQGGRSHIIIIGITAHTEGEAREECMQCGMDGFIEKPLNMTLFKKYYAYICLSKR